MQQNPTPYRLVFDIGKTNKKIVLFQGHKIAHVEKKSFPEFFRKGLLIEPLDAMAEWFMEELKKLAKQYYLESISLSCHGSVCVAVDKDGTPVAPVLSYMNEPQPQVKDAFKAFEGKGRELYKETCTPRLDKTINMAIGFLNACSLFPHIREKADSVLSLPAYIVMLLTGERYSEMTYLGCHTYLWNYRRWEWSEIAQVSGFAEMSPPILEPGSFFPMAEELKMFSGLDHGIAVMPGLHDSNASLVPYFLQYGTRFCLHSTGSWCVTMKPVEETALSTEEMNNGVFCNIDVFGLPVKTYTFPGGIILSRHLDLLLSWAPGFKKKKVKLERLATIIDDKKYFYFPSMEKSDEFFLMEGIKESPEAFLNKMLESGMSSLDICSDYFALVSAGIALAVHRVIEKFDFSKVDYLFLEGGFRNNRCYSNMLAVLMNNVTVARTDIEEATALGACLYSDLFNRDLLPVEKQAIFSIEEIAADELNMSSVLEYRKNWSRLYCEPSSL